MNRKTGIIAFVSILIISLFVSCGDSLRSTEGGSTINEYIYPYLRFEMDESGAWCAVNVRKGAKLVRLDIPESVVMDDGSVLVLQFKGFDDPSDAESLKQVMLPDNGIEVLPEALKDAVNLEFCGVKTESGVPLWGKLPELEREDMEFAGWYAGDQKIYEGMPIDPEYPKAEPVWRKHSFIEHEGKEPTCTEVGWKPYTTCATCDYTTYVEIPALGHDFIHQDRISPTCTEPGMSEHYTCSRCDLLFTEKDPSAVIDSVYLKPLGHDLKKFEALEPTCTGIGWIEHWECQRNDCHKYFVRENGSYAEKSFSDIKLDPIPHSYETVWSKNAEYHWHACSVCGARADEALHTWGEPEVTVKPTDKVPGEAKYICTVCRYEKTETLQPNNHHFEKMTGEGSRLEPTCTEDGFQEWRCTDEGCNLTYREVLPKKGHRNVEFWKASEPTCQVTGVKVDHFYCSDCDTHFSDKACTARLEESEWFLPKTDHVFAGPLIPDKDGKKNHYQLCKYGCGEKGNFAQHVFNQKNTDSNEYLRSSANCTDPAVYFMSCACGEKSATETFPYGEPLGHDLEKHEASEFPCAEDGNREYWHCNRCNKNFIYDADNKLREITDIRAEHSTRFKADDLGHQLECSVCGALIGDYHSHTITDRKWEHTKLIHWQSCEICKHKFTNTEAYHDFKYLPGGGRICTVCGYSESKGDFQPPGEGGFDPELENKEPSGRLSLVRDGNEITVRFIDLSESEYAVTHIKWILDDEIIEDSADKTILRFTVTEKRTYRLNCIFKNDHAISSRGLAVSGYMEEN